MATAFRIAIADREKLRHLDLPSAPAVWFGIISLEAQPDRYVLVTGEVRYEKNGAVAAYQWEARGRVNEGRCFFGAAGHTMDSARLPVGSPVRIAYFASTVVSRFLSRLLAKKSKEVPRAEIT